MRIVVTLCVLALVLATACGGKKNSSAAPNATAIAALSTPQPEPTASPIPDAIDVSPARAVADAFARALARSDGSAADNLLEQDACPAAHQAAGSWDGDQDGQPALAGTFVHVKTGTSDLLVFPTTGLGPPSIAVVNHADAPGWVVSGLTMGCPIDQVPGRSGEFYGGKFANVILSADKRPTALSSTVNIFGFGAIRYFAVVQVPDATPDMTVEAEWWQTDDPAMLSAGLNGSRLASNSTVLKPVAINQQTKVGSVTFGYEPVKVLESGAFILRVYIDGKLARVVPFFISPNPFSSLVTIRPGIDDKKAAEDKARLFLSALGLGDAATASSFTGADFCDGAKVRLSAWSPVNDGKPELGQRDATLSLGSSDLVLFSTNLGALPAVVLAKSRDGDSDWAVSGLTMGCGFNPATDPVDVVSKPIQVILTSDLTRCPCAKTQDAFIPGVKEITGVLYLPGAGSGTVVRGDWYQLGVLQSKVIDLGPEGKLISSAGFTLRPQDVNSALGAGGGKLVLTPNAPLPEDSYMVKIFVNGQLVKIVPFAVAFSAPK